MCDKHSETSHTLVPGAEMRVCEGSTECHSCDDSVANHFETELKKKE